MNQQEHLERVQCLFSAWRSKRKPRQRIPEELWAAALELSKNLGISKTCHKLHLNQGAFKKYRYRVEENPNADIAKQEFLELPETPHAVPFEVEVKIDIPERKLISIRLKDQNRETVVYFVRQLISGL